MVWEPTESSQLLRCHLLTTALPRQEPHSTFCFPISTSSTEPPSCLMSPAATSIILLISPLFSGHADTLWMATHSASFCVWTESTKGFSQGVLQEERQSLCRVSGIQSWRHLNMLTRYRRRDLSRLLFAEDLKTPNIFTVQLSLVIISTMAKFSKVLEWD